MDTESIRKAISYFRETLHAGATPEYMQVALKHLREEGYDVSSFDSLPDSAVMVLQKDKEPSVLVDDDGIVLCFR